jgi:hypothetical protein
MIHNSLDKNLYYGKVQKRRSDPRPERDVEKLIAAAEHIKSGDKNKLVYQLDKKSGVLCKYWNI